MYPTENKTRLNWAVGITSIALAAVFTYLLLSAVHTRNTTGTVTVIGFAKNASISVSQNNSTASVVGTGSAKVRLKPGSYQFTADTPEHTAFDTVTIGAKQKATIHLSANQPPIIPSPDYIDFKGLDTFISNGISSDQVYNLKNLFFLYKKGARTITVDKNSIQQEPHDPNSYDPFIIDFSGTIDGTAYKAKLAYSDLDNVELSLFNQSGAKLFDKASAQPPAGS